MKTLKFHTTLLLIGLSIIGLILLGCSNQQAEDTAKVNVPSKTEAVEVAQNTTASAPNPGNPDGKNPKLVFKELSHDFGKKTSGPELKHTFGFTNEGEATLIIEKVKAG